jgi:hypothetical protein
LPALADIPALISGEKLERIAGVEPFYCAVAFDSPAEGNGGVYDSRYWQSVIDGVRKRDTPIAGGKTGGNGHSALENDFYVIGALHEPQKNRVVFKLLVPQNGYSSSNEGLRTAINAGVQQFSIVANVEEEGDGIFYEELGVPRFDAVDEGAMRQTVYNARAKEEELLALIEKGAIDYTSEGNELIVNEKVCRKAALRMQFNGTDKALGARLMNAIAKRKRRNETMDKQQLLEALRNAFLNNQITLEDIAAITGTENKLKTKNDEASAAVIADVKKALGLAEDAGAEDVRKALDALLQDAEAASEADTEAQAQNIAGPATINGLENVANRYVKEKLRGVKMANRKTFIENTLKNDVVLKTLLGNNAAGAARPLNGNGAVRWR